MIDVRPRWQRWMAPHGHGGLVALSIAWFAIGLAGIILADMIGAGRAWRAVAFMGFWSWIMFGDRLHRRGRR